MRAIGSVAVMLFAGSCLVGCGSESKSDAGASGGAKGSAAVNPDELLPAISAEEGLRMEIDVVAPAGEEVWKCVVYELPNTNFAPVNRVRSVQNPATHHMDVMALAFTGLELENGVYDCEDLYAEHQALMEDGLIIYAAQEADQTIQLPEGTVASLPPSLQVMHEIHYVNTTTEDVDVYSRVNAYTIESWEARQHIWGGVVRDAHINIPPQSEHTEWSRCVMNQDIDLLMLSSHTHELGKEVRVRLFDGENVGEEIYLNKDWETPFLQSFADAPLTIKKGTGFEFSCLFKNDQAKEVSWGFNSTDEMCQIALVYTPGKSEYVCEVVETSDGVIDTTGTGG